MGGMASSSAPALRRDPTRRILGGVCAGLGQRFDLDPLLVRVAFVAAAMAGGLGFALYVLAWVAMPAGAGEAAARGGGRGSVEVALGVALLALSLLLAFRELGIWFSDAVVWPLVLVAAGGALLWRPATRAGEARGAGAGAGRGGGAPGSRTRAGAAPLVAA